MFNYILTNKKLKLSYKLCKIKAKYLLFKNKKKDINNILKPQL